MNQPETPRRMSSPEAQAVYEQWWKEKSPDEPLYTYSGWLRAKNIELTDEDW